MNLQERRKSKRNGKHLDKNKNYSSTTRFFKIYLTGERKNLSEFSMYAHVISMTTKTQKLIGKGNVTSMVVSLLHFT